MKYTKIMALLVAMVIMVGSLASCGSSSDSDGNSNNPTNAPTSAPNTAAPEAPTGTSTPSELELLGLDENMRFFETRSITVEIYDRANDGGTPPDNNFYTDYLKQAILDKHNIAIEFVRVPRWTEGQDIANLMAAGTAPDVCVTYSYPTIDTYGKMGGVIDMYPMLSEQGHLFPNLFDLLGTTNIYWDKDPVTNHVWAIEALLQENYATVTKVRADWLEKLNIPEPTTLQEFEDMLVAFRDNAELLLGADAHRIIPLMQTHDVRWGFKNVLDGFMPDNLTDKDRYIYGAIEGYILHDAAKEATRVYNKWYNMGLLWNDFSLYDNSNLGSIADDLIKSGYVGAWTGNHDGLYRNGETSAQYVMQQTVGEEASFIVVDPFPNDSGNVARLVTAPIDRKVFFPSTNDEPLASMLYLDFISSPEVRRFMQIGEEGVTHTVEADGAVRIIATTGDKIMNSPRNIDYTITINGLDLGDSEINAKSIALGYANIDAELIQRSVDIASRNARIGKAVNVGSITAEEGIMDEMNNKRDVLLINSIVATPENFDSVWDQLYQDLLRSGAQAILDERTEKWNQFFGDALFLD